jgi:hypothetical protein
MTLSRRRLGLQTVSGDEDLALEEKEGVLHEGLSKTLESLRRSLRLV